MNSDENNLIAFIKRPGLDSISKNDFELQKVIQLNSSKFKIKYATAYIYGADFQSTQAIYITGNYISQLHQYINHSKSAFQITFGDINCSFYKGKTKKIIRPKDFTIKIY